MALSRVNTNGILDGTIKNSDLAFDGGSLGFRNKIIGGDFTTNPWQRGTSFPAIANAEYHADRFVYSNAGSGVVTITKTQDAPTANESNVFSQHCLQLDVTTSYTPTSTDYTLLQQKIEGFNVASLGFGQSGTRYATLSFWHKHTKTGTYCVSFRNSATDRSYIAEYTQTVTDTWEKAIVTFPVDTSGTWLYDNGVGLNISWAIAIGTSKQTTANTWTAGNYFSSSNQVNALDSTANNFKIALVQFEVGPTATPFETRSYGTELALCQRYYYRDTFSINGDNRYPGYCYSTTVAHTSIKFPVQMRAAPTSLQQSGTAANYRVYYAATYSDCSSVPTFLDAGQYSSRIAFTVASGLTVGQGVLLGQQSGGYLGWASEL